MNEPEMLAYIANLLCEIKTLIASGGIGAGVGSIAGSGNPNGSVIGIGLGQIYTDIDTGSLYTFLGTPGTNTGWFP